jgi:hypothetical protein
MIMETKVTFEPLGNLLAGAVEFRPYAYFDKHLDAIRIQVVDGNVCEERLNKFITVYRSGPKSDESQIVGIVIKGTSHLLHSCGMDPTGSVQIAKFLNRIAQFYPSAATKLAVDVFGAWPETKPEEVAVAV